EQVVAEHTSHQSLRHFARQQTQDIERRKRDVPELVYEERRYRLAKSLRHQCEVIVLDPDPRFPLGTPSLVEHGLREPLVHVAIAGPVLCTHHHVLDQHVACRPEHAVRETEVIAFHVCIVQPYTPQQITLLIGWNTQAAVCIRGLAIRRSGTPGNPGPMRATHGRVECGDESTRRLAHRYSALATR